MATVADRLQGVKYGNQPVALIKKIENTDEFRDFIEACFDPPPGDAGGLASLDVWKLPDHMGEKFVLPVCKLRPVPDDLLCRKPPVRCDRHEAQVYKR